MFFPREDDDGDGDDDDNDNDDDDGHHFLHTYFAPGTALDSWPATYHQSGY